MDILFKLFLIAFVTLFLITMATVFAMLFDYLQVTLGFDGEWINKF